jgi:hypothetical protein
MSIEKFNEYNESINVNKLDSVSKKEILNLRTELNLYKKCLKKIVYDIDHVKKDKYDDGESIETLLYDIKEDIKNTNYSAQNLKK